MFRHSCTFSLNSTLKRSFVLFAFYAFSLNSMAIEFSQKGDDLIMTGEIKPGDYNRLISYLTDNLGIFMAGQVFKLDSPGGNVEEAIRLAEFIRKTNRVTIVPNEAECSSACFYMLVAGGARGTKSGKIGIHRPYYEPTRFKNLTPSQARLAYEYVDDQVRQYLIKMRVPDEVIRLMFATPSTGMEYLSPAAFTRFMGLYQPWYGELQSSACPEMSAVDEAQCMKWIATIDRISMVQEVFGSEVAKNKQQEMLEMKVLSKHMLQKLRGGNQTFEQAGEELRQAMVEQAHPGWKKLVATPAFTLWLKKQPPNIRDLAASEEPEDAIRLLTKYKKELGRG